VAAKVFRFKLVNPISVDQLKSEVNDPTLSVTDDAGGVVVDVNADEMSQADIEEALAEKGFELQGVFDPPPPTSAGDDFNQDLQAGGASCVGQVLYSVDGLGVTAEKPVTSPGGWLVNDAGTLLVVGG
jgi:hypothetical protein